MIFWYILPVVNKFVKVKAGVQSGVRFPFATVWGKGKGVLQGGGHEGEVRTLCPRLSVGRSRTGAKSTRIKFRRRTVVSYYQNKEVSLQKNVFLG